MSTPVTNLQIFAQVVVPAPFPAAITVNRADGCVVTNPAKGVFEYDTPAGLLSDGRNLLLQANATGVAGAAVIANATVVSQTKVRVSVFDAFGALADADAVWLAASVVPRVS